MTEQFSLVDAVSWLELRERFKMSVRRQREAQPAREAVRLPAKPSDAKADLGSSRKAISVLHFLLDSASAGGR